MDMSTVTPNSSMTGHLRWARSELWTDVGAMLTLEILIGGGLCFAVALMALQPPHKTDAVALWGALPRTATANIAEILLTSAAVSIALTVAATMAVHARTIEDAVRILTLEDLATSVALLVGCSAVALIPSAIRSKDSPLFVLICLGVAALSAVLSALSRSRRWRTTRLLEDQCRRLDLFDRKIRVLLQARKGIPRGSLRLRTAFPRRWPLAVFASTALGTLLDTSAQDQGPRWALAVGISLTMALISAGLLYANAEGAIDCLEGRSPWSNSMPNRLLLWSAFALVTLSALLARWWFTGVVLVSVALALKLQSRRWRRQLASPQQPVAPFIAHVGLVRRRSMVRSICALRTWQRIATASSLDSVH